MDEHARLHERPGRALLGFSLGTFTAVALVLGTIGLAHARGSLGDLLNGLNIAVGLLSFAVLWAVSAYASTTALRCLTLDPAPPWSRVVLRAAGAGGTIGAAIAAAGVLVLIVLAMVASDGVFERVESLVLLLLYGAAVAAVALLIGALLGALLGTLSRALLAAALLAERMPGVSAPVSSHPAPRTSEREQP